MTTTDARRTDAERTDAVDPAPAREHADGASDAPVGGGRRETGAEALLAGLRAAGVEVVFANLGSDHPAIIEALAGDRERGVDAPVVVLAPHETSALTAAHGYAQATGRAQAVLVHVDVGTANLGGAVHNIARARVPVVIVAGVTPYTLEGELPGTRNTYPNHVQDVPDQHGILRPYTKWSYDLRTAENARQLVLRGAQIARSAPRGPVYLTAAREVLAAEVAGRDVDPDGWAPVDPIPLAAGTADEIVAAIAAARFPVLVTSGLGQDADAVADLVELAETAGLGVVQQTAAAMAMPADHELHLGYGSAPLLDRADLLVVVDSVVPIVTTLTPAIRRIPVYVIDPDPLHEGIPLWYLEARRSVRADPALAVRALRDAARAAADLGDVDGRRDALAAEHRDQRERWSRDLHDVLTPARVAATLAGLIDDDTVVLNEAITGSEAVFRHLPRTRPGTLYGSGGSSLGWAPGAAVGMKLARPDATIVAVVGDGTYQLSEPASTYWMAGRYGTPFLTVILDNGGWNATKQNVLWQRTDGPAAASGRYFVSLAQTADLAGVAAAAGGAHAATVTEPGALEEALRTALDEVRGGRCAVVRVVLDAVSDEPADRPAP